MTLLGEETAAHVDPAVRHSGIVEILRDDRRRDQLAEGHDRIVPQFGVGGFVNRFHGHALQLVEERIDPFELFMAAPQIVDDARMVLPQRGDMLHGELFVALLKSFEHLFERVGRLAHGRNDDEEILLVVDNLAQVAHSVGITHRRTAKFVNLHVISLFNLTYLLYRPKATGRRTPAAERRVERPHPNASRRRRLPRRDRASARIISVFSPLCKALRYSGTGTNRCPPPRRYVWRWVCPPRGPHSTRCGSAPAHRRPDSAASGRRT